MNTDLDLSYEQTYEIVADLFSWSNNYDFPSPASLFLDLIGYSEDHYGERLCSAGTPNLGYREHHLLGWALVAYAHRPSAVLSQVHKLLEEEAAA